MLRSLPRRIEQVHLSISSLSMLPSPVNGRVGIHDFTFRGLLAFHSALGGLPDCRHIRHSYARLPDRFFARLGPTPVVAPRLIRLNEKLARQLGFDPGALATPEGLEILAGNRVPENGEPIAMAYAGHQFGNFVPQLGDGRAILLGEIIDRDGTRRDIQLKGAGRTPYSRGGDGRAALGPVLREYIVSEAMAALGIPTTCSSFADKSSTL